MKTFLSLVALFLSALFSLALSSPASAAEAPRAPNVLFIIADDASPSFGCYGCTWAKTPNIDRLAARGVTFDGVYTPTAKCAPSRAAILTGRNPWQLEAAANHQSYFPPQYKAFTEVLAEAGHGVGSQGKFWGPGIARTSDGETRTWGLMPLGLKKGAGPEVGFKTFLEKRPKDKPFFFWYGSTNPHRAYEPDSGLAAGKKPADIERVPKYWPDNDTVRRDMLDYAIEIERYDAEVGTLLKSLEESGEAENTLVIVTSDHGMPFPRVKGHNYDASNRVPLIAAWPKGIAKPGRRAAELVSLIDVAPTLLGLQGLDGEQAGMKKITGASLSDIFQDAPRRKRDWVILGRERNDVLARLGTPHGLGYPVRGIRQGNFLYLKNFEPDRWPCGNAELGFLDTDASPTKKWIEDAGDKDRYWQLCFGKRPAEELFDVKADPDCVKNLIDATSPPEPADWLRTRLEFELRAQDDPRIKEKGAMFDEYPSVKKVPTANKP